MNKSKKRSTKATIITLAIMVIWLNLDMADEHTYF